MANEQSPLFLLSMLLLFISIPISINADTAFPKKLEEIIPPPAPQVPNIEEVKCGDCPCLNPCGQYSQPLPPPPPPPPPKHTYCNKLAPPPPRLVYVTGNPEEGQLYHTDSNGWEFKYSNVERNLVSTLLSLIGCGMLGLLIVF